MKNIMNIILAIFLFVGQPIQKAFAIERVLSADLLEGIGTTKDYLREKGHFENNAIGWSAYADAAGTSPVDGTGGSPSVTCTQSTSAPLSGLGSFLITKGATNRQGDGCSVAFSIDTKHKGAVLRILADYAISSGTYADDDVRFYLYDVTNSRLIEPSANKIKNSTITSGSPLEPMEFQTSIDSTSYRLIIHVASTSASAYTVKIDDIKIGKLNAPRGPPLTDFQTCTGSGTWTTNVTYTCQYKRVGAFAEIWLKVVSNGSTPTGSGSNFAFNMPSGLVIDIAKMMETTPSGGLEPVGQGVILDSGTAYYPTIPTINTLAGTSVSMQLPNASATNLTQTSSINWGSNQPITFANNDAIIAHIAVPIVGWSSNVQMSSDTDTRVVAARYTSTSTAACASSGTLRIDFATKDYDTHSSVTTGASWIYTAPLPGYYKVGVGVGFGAGNNTGQSTDIVIVKNGVAGQRILRMLAGVSNGPSNGVGNGNIQLNAGDTIYLQAQNNGSASISLNGSATDNWTTIERLSGPSQIAASEAIIARYTSATGNTYSTSQILDFATKVKDNSNSVTTGASWKFTAPLSGTYRVTSSVTSGGVNLATNQAIYSELYKNGSVYSRGPRTYGNGTSQSYTASFSDTVSLLAGDYIDLRGISNVSQTLQADSTYNYINVERVGN